MRINVGICFKLTYWIVSGLFARFLAKFEASFLFPSNLRWCLPSHVRPSWNRKRVPNRGNLPMSSLTDSSRCCHCSRDLNLNISLRSWSMGAGCRMHYVTCKCSTNLISKHVLQLFQNDFMEMKNIFWHEISPRKTQVAEKIQRAEFSATNSFCELCLFFPKTCIKDTNEFFFN